MLFRSSWKTVPEDELLLFVVTGVRPVIEVSLRVSQHTLPTAVTKIEFFTETSQNAPWPWPFGAGLDVPADPLSSTTIEFVQQNIRMCTRFHPLCTQQGIRLPLRVLDVSAGAAGNEVKLVETTDLQGTYAMLSH